jgi:hypothetical protein
MRESDVRVGAAESELANREDANLRLRRLLAISCEALEAAGLNSPVDAIAELSVDNDRFSKRSSPTGPLNSSPAHQLSTSPAFQEVVSAYFEILQVKFSDSKCTF